MKKKEKKPPITWDKAKGHLKTITEHKLLVMRHCFCVGLYWRGLTHDLSKYMPTELLEGFRYYDDGKSSPNNGERSTKGHSDAWMHHKGRNRHHFEYWMDYRPKSREALPTLIWEDGTEVPFPLQPVPMPRKYVVEMLMDRISASKNYNKEAYTRHDPLLYFERGKGKALMHPQTQRELHGMLRILDERGEAELFRFVRDYYLKGYEI